MTSDPVMTTFLLMLLSLIVGMGVWYVTAEHYEDALKSLKQQNQILVERNRQLEDDQREVADSLNGLEHQLNKFGQALEGEPTGLDVSL